MSGKIPVNTSNTINKHLVVCLVVLAVALLSACGKSADSTSIQAGKVVEFKFKNGLRLIVKEDTRSPIAVTQVWYRIGSSYEHNGITGASHFLEHMMFKGTLAHGTGEFSRIISENGGRENAFTSRDYTAYFQTLEKSRLAISFELEADRMQGLLIPESEFKKEREVVIEERRLRTDDKPTALTYERFNAAAFQSSPYRIPVIGWPDDLKNMTVADLRQWYRRWYAPNNALIVVVGDVRAHDVYKLAKQYFEPLKAVPIESPKPQQESPQAGIKRIVVKAPAKLPYLIMGYHVPVANKSKTDSKKPSDKDNTDWEPYALEVAATILDGGKSSRLNRGLVREQGLAASVSADYDLFARLPSMFMIHGLPSQGKSVADLEKAFTAQLERLKTELVTQAEMDRVKARAVAEKVYQNDSQFYQGMLIGQMEMMGYSWKVAEDYVDRINKVTPEQVQQVAKKYFVEDALTVAILDPQPMSDKPITKKLGISGGRHAE